MPRQKVVSLMRRILIEYKYLNIDFIGEVGVAQNF